MKNFDKKLIFSVVVGLIGVHGMIYAIKPAPFLSNCWGAPGYEGYVAPAPGVAKYTSEACQIDQQEENKQLHGLYGDFSESCTCEYFSGEDKLYCLCFKRSGAHSNTELADASTYLFIKNDDGVLVGEK